jgi:hypothetical protein
MGVINGQFTNFFSKLKLNVNNTKYNMVLSRRRVDNVAYEALSIDNEQLEEVNCFKYLGVQIDNKLIVNFFLENRFSVKNFPKADEQN